MTVQSFAIVTLIALGTAGPASIEAAFAQGASPGGRVPMVTPGATTPNGVPLRNGNIWDGLPHQPDASVDSQEQAAGVLPSQQRIDKENRELDELDRKLLQEHGVKP